MAVKKYRGNPYHLWNPFTDMEDFLSTLGVGPTMVTRGEGVYVFNDRDERFITALSGLWNLALGYGRKELIDAATKQLEILPYASCFRQVHPVALEMASRLVELTERRYEHVYLGTNGSEAVETAIKASRQYFREGRSAKDKDRHKIISLRGSYHGVTYGAVSTSGLEVDREKFGPLLPGFLQIEPPYCYRCPYGKSAYPECGLECARALEKEIVDEGPETVAAFILEPVMGAFGIVFPPDEYYKVVAETCRKNGLLFIVDEVTTGFGRTGKLFASESWDPPPDIMCLGKAISSGYLPLSATLVTDQVYSRFSGKGRQFAHGSTASGHPVCAAVGLEATRIIVEENLSENARKVGEYLLTGLQSAIGGNAHVGDIRGKGLMIGIELVENKSSNKPVSERKAFGYVLQASSLGLLLYYSHGFLGLIPPLIIDEELADEIIGILDETFNGSRLSKAGRTARIAKDLAQVKLKRQ